MFTFFIHDKMERTCRQDQGGGGSQKCINLSQASQWPRDCQRKMNIYRGNKTEKRTCNLCPLVLWSRIFV